MAFLKKALDKNSHICSIHITQLLLTFSQIYFITIYQFKTCSKYSANKTDELAFGCFILDQFLSGLNNTEHLRELHEVAAHNDST